MTDSSFPILIRLSAKALQEFASCEEGSHEDGNTKTKGGLSAYEILRRRKTQIEVRDADEADLIYYAVCSGTFQVDDPANGQRWFKVASRIADTLRPFAKPETVQRWKKPSGF